MAISPKTIKIEESTVAQKIKLTLFSFGFKHGQPTDVNMVLDVRFLPNPYWVEHLRPMTGLVEEVASHVIDSKEGQEFMALLNPLIDFLITSNQATSKETMKLAVGCTGGRHRSVAIVEKLKSHLANSTVELAAYHRDIDLESD